MKRSEDGGEGGEYVLTSLAVSFFRLIFAGMLVASTEFGGN